LAIPYRTEIISIFEGHGQRADYRAVNPWGAVPGIKLDDGRVLSESNAILWFLSEGTAYRPTDAFEAAKVVQWLSFEAACPDQRRQSSVLDPHWQARCASGCYRRRQTRDRRTSVADPGRAIFRAPVHCGRRLHDRRHLHFRLCPSPGLSTADLPNFKAWIDRIRWVPGFLAKMYPYDIDPHAIAELP
jgi:glutathione S-transferase